MLSSAVAIVDKFGRPTPFLLKQWETLAGASAGSLETRVTDLELDVAALETTVTAQGASIAGLVADVSDLQVDVAALTAALATLTTRVSDVEVRAAFGGTVWPS